MDDRTIAIECAGWFVRDDGLVQIRNKRGKTVILSALLSKIWIKIEYEIKYEGLIRFMKEENMPEDIVKKSIDELVSMELVNVFDRKNSFDMMFS